jgi:hypothetical protein
MEGGAILPAFSKRGGHFPDGSSMLDGCFMVLRCNNRTEHLELSFFFGGILLSHAATTRKQASEQLTHTYRANERQFLDVQYTSLQ